MKTQRVYKIDGARITVAEIAQDVWQYGQCLKAFSKEQLTQPGSDFCGGDIRLQVRNGGWTMYHGDSQYDQDHRGYWGASCVPRAVSRKDARNIAIELLEEASQ